jgi:hypothetical protein
MWNFLIHDLDLRKEKLSKKEEHNFPTFPMTSGAERAILVYGHVMSLVKSQASYYFVIRISG